MKRYLIAMALASSALSGPALAATDVGVSIEVGQPGFYGRLDMGDYPRPALIYSEPVVVERVPVDRPPIYLHVPPGHARHWERHCHEYNACGERVYFVRDDWYNREYVPRYRELHAYNEHRDRDDRRHYRDERWENDHDRWHNNN